MITNDTTYIFQAYTVYFTRESGSSDDDYKTEWQVVQLPTNLATFVCKMDGDVFGLKPKTMYRFRVSASNDQSEGPASDVVEFETAAEGWICKCCC